MTRGVFNATVVDQAGDIQPNSAYEVRDTATNNLSTIYDVDTGGVAIANPGVTDADAFFRFYAEQGRYTITVTDNATVPASRTWVVDLNPTDDRDGPDLELQQPRTVDTATDAVSQGSDGDYFAMSGRTYGLDSTLLGEKSATYDLGVPGIRAQGPVYLDQFANITEESTDIGPIVQRALDALGGTEPLYIKPGVYHWETPVLVQPTDYEVYAGTSFYRAPILRGAHQGGVELKTSVDGYMMEFGRPWTGVAVLARGMEVSGLTCRVLGTPTEPKFLRMLAQNEGSISDIYTSGLHTGLHFDADDPAGDRQASANMTMRNLRIAEIPAGGVGYLCRSTGTLPSVAAAYLDFNRCVASGGEYGFRIATANQVQMRNITSIAQSQDNIYFEWLGLANRNIIMEACEIGNNVTQSGGFVKAESLNDSRISNVRYIRNTGEEANYGYYWKYATADGSPGTIFNVELEQDTWIIQDADTFTAYNADSNALTDNVIISNNQYSLYAPLTSAVALAYSYTRRRFSYAATTSADVIDLVLDNVGEYYVILDPTVASLFTITRTTERGIQNEQSLITLTNTGTADATFVYSGVTGNNPGTLAPGETARAYTVFDRFNNTLVIMGEWVIT